MTLEQIIKDAYDMAYKRGRKIGCEKVWAESHIHSYVWKCAEYYAQGYAEGYIIGLLEGTLSQRGASDLMAMVEEEKTKEEMIANGFDEKTVDIAITFMAVLKNDLHASFC